MSVSHLFFNSLFTHTIMSPVYVALLMDGVDSEHHLCHIELGHVLRESVLKFTKQSQQIASHVIIHHQVLQEETLSSLITKHHSITQTLTHHLIISTEHQRVVWLTHFYHTTTQNALCPNLQDSVLVCLRAVLSEVTLINMTFSSWPSFHW